jgi:8-oxo-dGTP pyrophosphatase MutT (NUDIX family)
MVEELVDLVDAHGIARVFGVPRSEVKQHKEEFLQDGLYQPIVIVVVIDHENRIVAQVRGKAKAEDGSDEVDLVCGVISAGELWQHAARREALEEIGVELTDLTIVDQRINDYQRHRTLAVARTDDQPKVVDEAEVARVLPLRLEELRELAQEGTAFVGGFFSDVELALAHVDL